MANDHQAGPPLAGPGESMDRRVTRVEDTLWGAWRTNGMVADLRAVRKEIEAIRKGQGRVFLWSVVATTASIVAILTVVLAAVGLGGGN